MDFNVKYMEHDLFAFTVSGAPAYYACKMLDEDRYELTLVHFHPVMYYDSVEKHIILTKGKVGKSEPKLYQLFLEELVDKVKVWERGR